MTSRWRRLSRSGSAGRSRSNGSKASSTKSSSPALEANALLSDGRCSLVGSYALTKDSLVVPGVKTAKLPDFEGATRDDRRRRVPIGVLAPSQPYIYSPLTVVLGEKARDRKISGVGDLAGLRIAIESGTLADAILMTFDKGRLIDNITHLVPGRDDLLGALTRGDFDATLLDLRRFDAYRAAHPDTKLAASGYYYPIGVNRGYVGLASDPALIGAVNKALSDLQAAGTIADLARGGRPHLSAARRTGDPRRRISKHTPEVTSPSPIECLSGSAEGTGVISATSSEM